MIEVSDMMSDLLTSAEIVSTAENLSVHRPTWPKEKLIAWTGRKVKKAQSKMPKDDDMIVTDAILCQDLEMRKHNELADSSVCRHHSMLQKCQ